MTGPTKASETFTSLFALKSHPLAKGDYLQSSMKPGASETGKSARENQEALRGLAPGKRLPLLVDARKMRTMDKEAREVYASESTLTFATCVAIVADSPVVSMLANIHLTLFNPKCPTKLFAGEESALKWMAQHRAGEPDREAS